MKFTFCFAKNGKTPIDAKDQATLTGYPVLFFDGIFRYICFPNDHRLYDFTTREDVANIFNEPPYA